MLVSGGLCRAKACAQSAFCFDSGSLSLSVQGCVSPGAWATFVGSRELHDALFPVGDPPHKAEWRSLCWSIAWCRTPSASRPATCTSSRGKTSIAVRARVNGVLVEVAHAAARPHGQDFRALQGHGQHASPTRPDAAGRHGHRRPGTRWRAIAHLDLSHHARRENRRAPV